MRGAAACCCLACAAADTRLLCTASGAFAAVIAALPLKVRGLRKGLPTRVVRAARRSRAVGRRVALPGQSADLATAALCR